MSFKQVPRKRRALAIVAYGSTPKLSADADEEAQADAAAGYPRFLTFNVSDDAARVQDIVTAIAYASRDNREVEVYASGDAALWSIFAAAVSPVPVSLHLENVPALTSDAAYLQRFNVPASCAQAASPSQRNSQVPGKESKLLLLPAKHQGRAVALIGPAARVVQANRGSSPISVEQS